MKIKKTKQIKKEDLVITYQSPQKLLNISTTNTTMILATIMLVAFYPLLSLYLVHAQPQHGLWFPPGQGPQQGNALPNFGNQANYDPNLLQNPYENLPQNLNAAYDPNGNYAPNAPQNPNANCGPHGLYDPNVAPNYGVGFALPGVQSFDTANGDEDAQNQNVNMGFQNQNVGGGQDQHQNQNQNQN